MQDKKGVFVVNEEKGLERTYGRGSGEREFRRIPMMKNRKPFKSALYHPNHAPYPQSGAYASEEAQEPKHISNLNKDENA